jgi:hypothetical protein
MKSSSSADEGSSSKNDSSDSDFLPTEKSFKKHKETNASRASGSKRPRHSARKNLKFNTTPSSRSFSSGSGDSGSDSDDLPIRRPQKRSDPGGGASPSQAKRREKAKPGKPRPRPGATKAASAGGGDDVYVCDRGCGYEGVFDAVLAHENSCDGAGAGAGAGGYTAEADVYVCERGCGFEGAFAAVAAHEGACRHVRPLEMDSDMDSGDEAAFLSRFARLIYT